MIKLSAVIITYNEERNIERCLNSLQGIADEIIVVDSFSTDKTQQICAQFKVKFISHHFEGHIQQKNWAMKQSLYTHVISLDADEALSDQLKESIISIKSHWENNCYSMNRLTNYCGTWIRHGSWYPDTKVRLVNKQFAKWGGHNPHDKLICTNNTKPSHIKGDLLHYSYYSVEQHYQQQEKFSSIAAQALFEQGKKAPLYKLALNPIASIIKDILIHHGFLDGKQGFIIAKISAISVFWKYKKLRALWAVKGQSN